MIVAILIYLASHFALFVLVLRHLPPFQREKTIFLYHAMPAAGVALLAVSAWIVMPDAEMLARAILIVCLQGIYSLSFLEVWSLAQIGYSLAILAAFDDAGPTGNRPDLSGLERTGARKKAERIEGLCRLGLVSQSGPEMRLTAWGRCVTAALAGLAALINLKRTF
jgi:hypothetical protein